VPAKGFPAPACENPDDAFLRHARKGEAMRYVVLSVCLLAALFFPALCPAAEKGHLERGIVLYNEDQYGQARAIWEAGEQAGDLDCAVALGTYVYSAGRGAPQSDQKAFAQYMKAAQKGHAEGMSVVGSCYLHGMGVAKDKAKGLEWLTKAANAGETTASAELGDLYADGDIVKKDAALAAKWHLKAAGEGHPQSQLYIGKAYMGGDGVRQDSAAAKEWLQKALAGGETAAKVLLEKLN
jgi:TPR repeat protein